MKATFRAKKRPARIRVRVTVRKLPGGASVKVSDVMLQPGGSVSGWLPHTTELPWVAGISA